MYYVFALELLYCFYVSTNYFKIGLSVSFHIPAEMITITWNKLYFTLFSVPSFVRLTTVSLLPLLSLLVKPWTFIVLHIGVTLWPLELFATARTSRDPQIIFLSFTCNIIEYLATFLKNKTKQNNKRKTPTTLEFLDLCNLWYCVGTYNESYEMYRKNS